MANELTLAASLVFSKGGIDGSLEKGGVRLSVAGSKLVRCRQTVGTIAEPLELGDMTTPGYCLMYNCAASNYVKVRSGESGADVVKIRAGGIALFELATATPYVIADTAACDVDYLLIEV